jgi:hypothetical protein
MGDPLVKVDPKPSRQYAEYVRKIKCDQWESAGMRGSDKGLLVHKATGETVAYNLHDGGNDWNGPRNFALEIQRLCGCRLIEPRGRKKSRKSLKQDDQQLAAARAKHAAEFDARLAEQERAREQERLRRLAVRVAEEKERRRREIERLMRP